MKISLASERWPDDFAISFFFKIIEIDLTGTVFCLSSANYPSYLCLNWDKNSTHDNYIMQITSPSIQ